MRKRAAELPSSTPSTSKLRPATLPSLKGPVGMVLYSPSSESLQGFVFFLKSDLVGMGHGTDRAEHSQRMDPESGKFSYQALRSGVDASSNWNEIILGAANLC